jgi:predicted dehydrogenase
MKFLIAGYGSIGRRHLRNLQLLGEDDILLYRSGKSTLSTDEVKDIPVIYDIHEALAHKPDAVIVANPTALHLDAAIPAAEAGCHLFMEKPISHNLEGLDQLKQALNENGGKAFVGFQFRFHPGLRKINDLLSDGAVGQPISARAHWGEYLPDWHPWEDYRNSYSARADLGGGVVLTLCHPLDYMRWLLGEVESLWALTHQLSELEMDVEGVAEIGLRFAGGTLGSVHVNYGQRPPVHHLEVVGSKGTLRWDNADGEAHLYSGKADCWETFAPPEDFERNDLFLAEMKHFIDVAKGKTEPLCTLQDGVRVLEIVEAVHAANERAWQF